MRMCLRLIDRGIFAALFFLVIVVSPEGATANACSRLFDVDTRPTMVDVTVSDGVQAHAFAVGDPVELRWQLTQTLNATCKAPVFLIIAVPEAVRFSGDGFVALPPNSTAPFGINIWQNQMRSLFHCILRCNQKGR